LAWLDFNTSVRQGPDHFEDQELALVYIAKRLKEAQSLEDYLSKSGVDYLVEPDRFMGGTIFRRELIGAFFYVTPEAEVHVRQLLATGGFKPWNPETEA
jgi:hypothetical protein